MQMSQLHPDPGNSASVDQLLHERLEQLKWHIDQGEGIIVPAIRNYVDGLCFRYADLVKVKIKREQANKKSRVHKKKVQPIVS